MGMYDYVNIDRVKNVPDPWADRSPDFPQVKCWDCSMHCYNIGDRVPSVRQETTYSIKLTTGGYLNINDSVLVSFTEEPQFTNLFDKWGSRTYPHD